MRVHQADGIGQVETCRCVADDAPATVESEDLGERGVERVDGRVPTPVQHESVRGSPD